jgi:hypothetical protein
MIDQSGSAPDRSRRICSIMYLVQPYGLVQERGKSSVIGTLAGTPYTVAEELKTKRRTWNSRMASHRLIVLSRLLR